MSVGNICIFTFTILLVTVASSAKAGELTPGQKFEVKSGVWCTLLSGPVEADVTHVLATCAGSGPMCIPLPECAQGTWTISGKKIVCGRPEQEPLCS